MDTLLADYAAQAEHALTPALWAYLSGGSESGTALRRNRAALDEMALVPRVLADVSVVDASTQVFGRTLALPVLLAPVGSLHRVDGAGIEGVARVAADLGVAYAAGSALPDAQTIQAGAAPCPLFQLYVEGDDAWVAEQVRHAAARGFAGVILTVDTPVFPVRPGDVLTRNHAALRSTDGTSRFRRAFDWAALQRVIAAVPAVPIVVKGIQDPRDAARARDLGAAGIYLSNHGGRQFDQGPATLSLLPDIVRAVAGDAVVIVDGGFLSGNDVLKAIALGADLVGIGRGYLYPYAVGGEAALAGYLSQLAAQLRTNLALLGAPTLADLKRFF